MLHSVTDLYCYFKFSLFLNFITFGFLQILTVKKKIYCFFKKKYYNYHLKIYKLTKKKTIKIDLLSICLIKFFIIFKFV